MSSPLTLRLNGCCRIGIELAFLLFGLFILIFPFHQAATLHFNVAHTTDSSHIIFQTHPKTKIDPGVKLPVYRFNPDWKMALGQVEVVQVQDGLIYCSFDPSRFRWPMGRHGRILDRVSPDQGRTRDRLPADRGRIRDRLPADEVRVDLGQSLGFKEGDALFIFKDRRLVGKIALTRVLENTSWAKILGETDRITPGLTVTEYMVATQVVYFNNPLLSLIEWIGLGLMLLWYGFFFWKHHQSPFLVYGPLFTAGLKTLYGKKGVRWFSQCAAGGLLVWFMTHVLVNALIPTMFRVSEWVRHFSGMALPVINVNSRTTLFFLYGLGILLCGVTLFRTSRSPILVFWDLFQYRRPSVSWLTGFPRHGMIWLMQLIIFYAFGSNLIYFIGGNINEMVQIAWPSMAKGKMMAFNPWNPLSVGNWVMDVGLAVEYMVAHKPDFWNVEIMFLVLRYFLWTITCISCLLAYLHSVISITWGYRIRNLDFTIMGWFSNGICYPLLGFLVWPMVPSMHGTDPTITTGTWFTFMLSLDFYLNLLYTLSIWNLGLKFGVMTDKGLRTSGFYRVIRHPNYTLEAPMFLLMAVIGTTTVWHWLGASLWILIYYIRAEREDHFMSRSNPDYPIYQQETPYKFIPGVY